MLFPDRYNHVPANLTKRGHMNTEIPVIFRKRPEGELIALLPTIGAGFNNNSCLAFTRDQGKIAMDISIMRTTVAATPEEYQALLALVVHHGYFPVRVCKRIKEYMNLARLRSYRNTANIRQQERMVA